MALDPGSKLGSYEILGPLGAGGMGEVYRARDPKLGRLVAIKVLPAEVARDPDRLGRFRREASLLAALTHGKGIVHRDLKPGNVKLTPEGEVKVLDFGLAKAYESDPVSGGTALDLSQSPTLAQSGTVAGVVLGTATYMSPEQASGKAVDKRADIWSFGVVFSRCSSGRRSSRERRRPR